jgi:hypothetical protein
VFLQSFHDVGILCYFLVLKEARFNGGFLRARALVF